MKDPRIPELEQLLFYAMLQLETCQDKYLPSFEHLQEAVHRHYVTYYKDAYLDESCPKCNGNFDGGPIPEEHWSHYTPPFRFSRKIGITENDRVARWKCPDCGHEWPR